MLAKRNVVSDPSGSSDTPMTACFRPLSSSVATNCSKSVMSVGMRPEYLTWKTLFQPCVDNHVLKG